MNRAGAAREAVFVLRPTLTVDRVWRPRDGLVFNCLVLNVPAMCALQLMLALSAYPEASVLAATLVAGAFCLALTVVYAYLGSSHPRNGGDYLFQRRLFSPRTGAIFGFTAVVIGGGFGMAFAGWIATHLVAAPSLVLAAEALDEPRLAETARALQSTTWTIVAAVVLAGIAAALNLPGLRSYARYQMVALCIAAAAMVCAVVLFAAAPLRPDEAAFGSALEAAAGVRHTAQGTSLVAASLRLSPLMALSFLPLSWSVILGGQIDGAAGPRGQMRMILPAEAAVIGLSAALTALLSARFGRDGLVAGALLFVHEPARLPLPCPPLYWVESGWSLLAPAALLLATTVCLCLWVASIALAGSRLLQVVSADRLLPRWLAGGVTRRGVPRRALVAFLAVAALPTLAFWLSDSWLLALAAYAMVLISSVATAAAGAVYPYLRREDYRESTAAPSEILGLPTIALAGGLFVLFGGYAVWSWLFDSPPVAGYQPLVGRIVLVGMYLCTLSVFTVYRWMRRVRPGRQIELSCEPIAPGDGKR